MPKREIIHVNLVGGSTKVSKGEKSSAKFAKGGKQKAKKKSPPSRPGGKGGR